MPPVLRRPASSNSSGQKRQTLRRPASSNSTGQRRQTLRRPASSNSTDQRGRTRPAAVRQTRRSTQQVGSLASSSRMPDGSTLFNFDYNVWLSQVHLGRRRIESAPTYHHAREAAVMLGKKIRCAICGRQFQVGELNFRQWTSTVWTGHCNPCESGGSD